MNYEIVELKEKIVAGISANTSNEDPKMGEIIGKLWMDLYTGGISAQIKNKVNQFSIGLYSDYNENGYQVTVGHEVSTPQEGVAIKRIPAGKYAKFFITGNMQKAVADAWGEIWGMELDRSYAADFEEYLNADCENAEINIYIALN